MTTIELKYDAFNIKTTLTVNGTEHSLRCFGTGSATLLREWIDNFFPELIKFCNLGPGADCEVQFYGTLSDYEDVKSAYNGYILSNKDIKLHLHPCRRYPQAVDEVMAIILKKKDDYANNIESKKNGPVNPASHENAAVAADVEKRFSNDKRRLEDIRGKNRENALSILTRAGEGFALTPDLVTSKSVKDENKGYGAALLNTLKTRLNQDKKDAVNTQSELTTVLADMYHALLNDEYTGPQVLKGTDVKDWYDRLEKGIVSTFKKNVDDLKELLASVFDRQMAALHSGYEEVYDTYAADFSRLPVSLYRLQKHSLPASFIDTEPFPGSCLGGLKINTVSSTVSYGKAIITKNLEKALNDCQEYMDLVFDKAKQRFMAETEECGAYYVGGLSEMQKALWEKLLSNTTVEQEILLLKNKVECLEELQVEINKLVTT